MPYCNTQDRAGWFCILVLGHGGNHVHRWPWRWKARPGEPA